MFPKRALLTNSPTIIPASTGTPNAWKMAWMAQKMPCNGYRNKRTAATIGCDETTTDTAVGLKVE